jgi:dephospho-CoA kinase
MTKAGLTGSIGSGKTLVAEIFRTLGIPVFQADQEARNLYRWPEVKEQLALIIGKGIFDDEGEVDRKKMAEMIFTNKDMLGQVNELIHPLVRKRFQLYAERHAGDPYVIYEAAILIESGYYQEMDQLIVVYAPEALRIERVKKRDGVTEEEIRKRIRNQAPDEEKMERADWVIYNDESRLVIPQVLKIDQLLRQAQAT